ncbi:MAG: hypothetical protein KC561_19920, partial [Myxococcales bacterium]|nr:hypothetical protein [Myxococcales bacterium]
MKLRALAAAVLVGHLVCLTFGCGEEAGDGEGLSCPEGQSVQNGECVNDDRRPGRDGSCSGQDLGTDSTATVDMGSDQASSVDLSGSCTPDERGCADEHTTAFCNQDGDWLQIGCLEGEVCNAGFCSDTAGCVPNTFQSCLSSTTYERCNASGDGTEEATCPTETPNCGSGL